MKKQKQIRAKSTRRKEEVKNRLRESIQAVERGPGGLPDSVGETIKAIQQKSREMFNVGFGHNTLNRKEYKSIWHPKFKGLP